MSYSLEPGSTPVTVYTCIYYTIQSCFEAISNYVNACCIYLYIIILH